MAVVPPVEPELSEVTQLRLLDRPEKEALSLDHVAGAGTSHRIV